jgi:hypothetical protein
MIYILILFTVYLLILQFFISSFINLKMLPITASFEIALNPTYLLLKLSI